MKSAGINTETIILLMSLLRLVGLQFVSWQFDLLA